MRLVEQFFRVLAPSSCVNCGTEGTLLCPWCSEEALIPTDERCYRCNKLSSDYRTCATCQRHSPIRHLWVRAEYTEIARLLVHEMKFKYSTEAAETIARQLVNTLPVFPADTMIVPVPTISRHIRERGFDHVKRVAQSTGKATGLQVYPALLRLGQDQQVGASRSARLQQVKNAFAVRPRYDVNGAKLLLIDDVLTTGATLEAAAQTLKAAGAKQIDAAIFAKVK